MDALKENIEQLGTLLKRLTVHVAELNRRLNQVERSMESAAPNFIMVPQANMPPIPPELTIEMPIEECDLSGISSALFFHRMCQKLDNTYEDDDAFREAQRCIQVAKHFHHAWSLSKEEDE